MAIDKYSRSNFYNRNQINGIQENDLAFNKFKDFKFTAPQRFYEVTDSDITRPDLISYKLYKKVNYWWILLKVNGIEDPWNDLEVGQILNVPASNEIEEFVLKSRKNNR
jgi:hypothetical protein